MFVSSKQHLQQPKKRCLHPVVVTVSANAPIRQSTKTNTPQPLSSPRQSSRRRAPVAPLGPTRNQVWRSADSRNARRCRRSSDKAYVTASRAALPRPVATDAIRVLRLASKTLTLPASCPVSHTHFPPRTLVTKSTRCSQNLILAQPRAPLRNSR